MVRAHVSTYSFLQHKFDEHEMNGWKHSSVQRSILTCAGGNLLDPPAQPSLGPRKGSRILRDNLALRARLYVAV